ncbi:MAG: DUF721 domain-containing protein [Armatimonadetes bacterium]|nr:DUF721 domain-containing protein [Armatimonadota bacterium]
MRRSDFRRGNFNRLGGLVNRSLEEMGLRHKIMQYQAVIKWKQVVGTHIAAVTVAERIQEGILYVCCKSSAWANECTFHKQHIIKELNKAAGSKVVTDIRFSSRGFKKALEASLAANKPNIPKDDIEAVEIDLLASELAQKVASISPSEELAKRIAHAVLTSKKLEKSKLENGWRKCSMCNNLHDGKSDICDNCK